MKKKKKKEASLKEISSEQLRQELIVRCENQITSYECDIECVEAEMDDLQETIDKLNEIILE